MSQLNPVCAQHHVADSIWLHYRQLSAEAKIRKAPETVRLLTEHHNVGKAAQVISAVAQLPVKPSEEDYKRGMLYYSKALLCGTDSSVQCQRYAEEAARSLAGHANERSEAYTLVAMSYYLKGRFDSTILVGQQVLPSVRQSGNTGNALEIMLYMSRSYDRLGNRRKGIEICLEAIDLARKNKEYNKLSELYISLSTIYKEEDIQVAKRYALEALRVQKTSPNKRVQRSFNTAYLMLGNVYHDLGQPDSAMYFYELSKEKSLEIGDWRTYLSVVGNIGNVYYQAGNYEKALEYNLLTLAEYRKIGLRSEVAVAYGSLADIYKDMKRFRQAILYYDSALAVTKQVGSADDFIYNYKGLSETYEMTGDYRQAFYYYKLYKQWNDSINNNENSKRIAQLELSYRYKTEQKERDLAQRNKDLITQEKLSRQKFIIWTGVLGTLVLLGFLAYTIKTNLNRKKTNARLHAFNEEIMRQKHIIEEKNHEITDSITYASRIQQGVIPDDAEMRQFFPRHFVFFRPRDIVSGDFYWANRTTDDRLLLAVADCTGHGVPGAFMSLVGNTLLNQTLNHPNVNSPAQALDYINQQLPKTIRSKSTTGAIKDGMEISMCEFDLDGLNLRFAGANSHIYLVREGQLQIYRGDKQPIGESLTGHVKGYTDQLISLQRGDCIYLITDGFADQFGGNRGKKFKYKPLEDLFCLISRENPEEQLRRITSAFDDWKRDHEQVDDVLVLGIMV